MRSRPRRKRPDSRSPIRIPYSANSTDVGPQVLQLKEKNPDVVIFVSYTADAILYMKTMRNLEYMPPMVIGDDSGFSDPSFIPGVADVAQGVMNRSAWDIGKPGSTTYKINEMYKAKTGRDLDDTSARNMQGFFALADAINRAGSTDPEKIREALIATDLKPDQLMMGYDGVKFDQTGQNNLAADLSYSAQGPCLRVGMAGSCRNGQGRMADEGLEVVAIRHLPPGLGGRCRLRFARKATGYDYGSPSGHRRRPHAGRPLCFVLLRSYADLGHDEFHQFRAWRVRHARNVCGAFCPHLARRRTRRFRFRGAAGACPLGVFIYFSLVRHVMRGPMLAQILSTFGLALLLRYIAFWIFSANFVSLPKTSLSGIINIGGILIPVSQLVAGLVAISLTVGLHLLLTRHQYRHGFWRWPTTVTQRC